MSFRTAGLYLAIAMAITETPAATASMLSVNGTTVFRTDYEADAATALTFNGAGNSDALDLDPTTTLVGSWYTAGSGTFEKPNSGSASYTVSSREVQVTNSTTGPDPGPFQGINYLRGVRTSGTTGFSYANLWETTPGVLATDGNDLIEFTSAVYVSSFVGASTNIATLATFYNNDTAFAIRLRLGVNNLGDLMGATSAAGGTFVDTGLNLLLNDWNVVKVAYQEGSSTWSLTNNGQTATGLAVTANGAGPVSLMSYGGGVQLTLPNTARVYFDAIPEPATWVLSILGGVGIAGIVRHKKMACIRCA